MNETIEIGYTVSPERWRQAAATMITCAALPVGKALAAPLREKSDGLVADLVLAAVALSHVAEFAADAVWIVPIYGAPPDRGGGEKTK